jgi:hypothetical protein
MRLDLQLAGFQFQPLVLDALAPISEQCEPVVVRPILEAGAN